jgi:ribosomal protein L21E
MTVPQTVTVGSGTRYAFVGWNDAETTNTRVISSGSFTARYNKEYLMTINSAYGSPAGAGWYEDGATANFSITSPVTTSNSKHYFTGWSGNYIGAATNGSIVMSTPQTITANWRTENLLTINSEYGELVGAGWYDEGESVNISIDPVYGFIIRHSFTGWSGDLTDTASNSVVTMTSPKVITANWETDYLQLYILIVILLVVGGAGAVLVIYLYRLKKRQVKKS